MEDGVTRREFLAGVLGVALGASAIASIASGLGCGASSPVATASPAGLPVGLTEPSVVPSPAVSPSPGSTATSSPVAIPSPSPTIRAYADLSVVQGTDYMKTTKAAVSEVGGIERFVPKGAVVVIKPNIGFNRTPEYAATTHPDVVVALIQLCQQAGASKITVLDYAVAGANVGYQESGIEEAVKRAGANMERISSMKFKRVDVPLGRQLKSVRVYQDVLDADVIIDVPIAKHHNLAGLSLGMKNLMGVIADRGELHQDIGQRVADLCTVVRPKLTVVDATRILLRNGPSGGNLADVKKLDLVIASPDIVAADAYAATLFGMVPSDLATVRAGHAMGLGTLEIDKLRIAKLNA